MEINNRTHLNHEAYLHNQQVTDTEKNNVTPLEQIKEEQKGKQNSPESTSLSNTINSQASITKTEQLQASQSLTLFEPINLTRARIQPNPHDTRMDYKITAHEERVTHQAEKAINSYHAVENSQYGQELVNRIELMV